MNDRERLDRAIEDITILQKLLLDTGYVAAGDHLCLALAPLTLLRDRGDLARATSRKKGAKDGETEDTVC